MPDATTAFPTPLASLLTVIMFNIINSSWTDTHNSWLIIEIVLFLMLFQSSKISVLLLHLKFIVFTTNTIILVMLLNLPVHTSIPTLIRTSTKIWFHYVSSIMSFLISSVLKCPATSRAQMLTAFQNIYFINFW